jgi:hypothetical protein
MQQTIDERLELDFSLGSQHMTLSKSDLGFSSLPTFESPSRSPKPKASEKIMFDDKIRKMGSPRAHDELDCSTHQRRHMSPKGSLSDLDESNHVCRWMLEE